MNYRLRNTFRLRDEELERMQKWPALAAYFADRRRRGVPMWGTTMEVSDWRPS